MALVGYARVSTRVGRQVLDRQVDALTNAGCLKIFEDRLSGVQADRHGLVACLRNGDVLTVLDLDRLGRRARDLIGLIEACFGAEGSGSTRR